MQKKKTKNKTKMRENKNKLPAEFMGVSWTLHQNEIKQIEILAENS